MESDLSKPVSDWLTAQGFTPYAEVQFPGDHRGNIDLIGKRGTEVIAVELKRSLTRSVVHQAYMCGLITDQRYAAVGTRPSKAGVAQCRKVGIGLLSVRNGVVDVVTSPSQEGALGAFAYPSYLSTLYKILDRMKPHGVGGVPCMKGVGPAQDCYNRVQSYLEVFPEATWRQIFNGVHNHYGSPSSMCGAMRVVAERRRERMPAGVFSGRNVTIGGGSQP